MDKGLTWTQLVQLRAHTCFTDVQIDDKLEVADAIKL